MGQTDRQTKQGIEVPCRSLKIGYLQYEYFWMNEKAIIRMIEKAKVSDSVN